MKISINLDFDSILYRIEKEKEGVKPGEWAKMVGVSPNIVSNVHGKMRQKPSLEYIVAVSLATGKSVDYFLFGDKSEDTQPPISNNFPISEYLKQKDLARKIYWNSLKLGGIKAEVLKEINDFIQFKISVHDRRKEVRRKKDTPDRIPECGDRRSGLDRRESSAGK